MRLEGWLLNRWSLATFVAFLVVHVAHDLIWFWIGRYTAWLDLESSFLAAIVTTLVLTALSRWLGRRH